MRVLVSGFSGFGHVQPMLPLALALRDRGNDLLFATAEDARARIEGNGLDFAPVGPAYGANVEEFRRRYPEALDLPGTQLPPFMFPRLFGEISAPAALTDLLPLATAWEPEVIVHDMADFAAPIVAAALDVPNVVHSFGAVLPASRFVDAAVFVEPLWREHGLEPRPFGGAFDHLYLDIYPPSMQPRGDHSHLRRVQRLRVVSSHEPDDDRLPPDIAAAVTGDRPVVYLTFGTVFFVNPTFAAAIDALAHRSDLVTVVTVGPRGDTEAFGPQPEHVHIERFVPQETLLPRCTAVVSHGGSGTVLGTLAHGLPQLVLPQGADQFINADACVDSGVGLALHGPEADADAIGAAVAGILERDDLRAGARRVQADIAGMPSPDEAAAVIESM